MFINAMGLILADHKRIQLGELSRPRALAAVPFGGRYRIIDFMLSNMVNSGITSIGVIAMSKYKSLMDHLGTGSSWDLDRKKQGLNILPPYINSVNVDKGGEIDDLTGLLDFFRANKHKYVVVANSNIVFNATLNDFVCQHEDSGDDMSVLYNRDSIKFGSPSMILDLDRRGMLRDVMLNPPKPASTRCSLGVVVLSRELLIDWVSESVARGEHDFSVDNLLKRFDRCRIHGYEFRDLVLRINSIPTYFASTMRLLEENTRRSLFWSGLPVYTKVKDEAPTLYGVGNEVSNSVISDGCLINGTLTDSMLFRGVTVSAHANVRNCVIMQDTFISEGVELDHVIVDKNCVIRPGIKLVGQKDYPVVIGKGAIV
ncbi:MAG: glucose-1-phosphate adenylyltransferase subunit GlgD [Clostridiaceae bacterium]|nr:glucose-1-phosphate adenylyltransferase subunit GlgD [Clostridiaceae bacterium]